MSTRAQTLRKAARPQTRDVESVQSAGAASASVETEKENRANGSASAAVAVKQEPHPGQTHPKGRAGPAHARARRVYCSCRQPDDGSPMILCSECQEWYHFRCLDLKERDAEDIQLYVCPTCHEKTGLCSVMEWEGPEALEEREEVTAPSRKSATPAPPPRRRQNVTVELEPRKRKVRQTEVKIKKEEPEAKEEEEEESSDDGSEDEYVAEKDSKGKGKVKGKRRAVATDSGTESDGESKSKGARSTKKQRRQSTASTAQRTRTVSVSASPEPAGPGGRRRKSMSASTAPVSKRKRADTTSSQTQGSASGSGEDAARKYCLTKLQEIFSDIFLRYPILNDSGGEGEIVVDKKTEDLTEEEKELLQTRAKKFTSDLEECMYELYAEPDKTGKHGVAAKYKERFRMLSFNLSKVDRVVLHKRIAAARITPRELSTMSSTDLANEETKQNIRQAEQEALAHSILKKTIMPRAKITHKGLQDIEDVNEAAVREEREHEQEEEERIERERQERLKLQAQRAQTVRAPSGSAPPDSPVTPHTPGWGAPPPIPLHAMSQAPGDAGAQRPSLNAMFIPTQSEPPAPAPPAEQELNLADLINIDEEPGQEVSISLAQTASPISETATAPEPAMEPAEGSAPLSPPPPTPSTGLSPFASRSSFSEGSPRPSFDLNAVWTAPSTKDESEMEVTAEEREDHEEDRMHVDSPDETKIASLDTEIIGEMAEDQDFDMFLGGGEEEAEAPHLPDSPEAQFAAFEALPKVWHGKLSMPLDSTIPQEVSVSARQMGGRSLSDGSPSWKVLFPADHLRIDGRVPVDKSAQYLTAMRLNPTKELIAVAFSPNSEASAIPFDTLAKHLIAKGRHGLIFPWGNRPKEHHPGRELYIVPLLPSEPIPDFVELLDELRFPSSRSEPYLIGIWVLNKGKLELATPPASTTPPVQNETIVTASPAGAAPAPAPSTSTLPIPFSQLLPTAFQPPPAAGQPPNINSAALAAEVASLTPEQIQLMLRTLQANTVTSIAAQPSIPPPQPPSSVPPGPQIQPWMNPPQNYQAPYSPNPVLSTAQSPPHPPPSYGSPRRFDRDANRQPYPPTGGHQYDSFDRGGGGDRSRGRGGGSWGRGRGQGSGQQTDRPRDAGWRGRARGRGQSSPTRGQWNGQQQWN